jgi:hypothetical protein
MQRSWLRSGIPKSWPTPPAPHVSQLAKERTKDAQAFRFEATDEASTDQADNVTGEGE